MNKDILNRLNKVAKKLNQKINFTDDDKNKTLRELGLDSLTTVDMIITIEDELGVHISNEALTKIKTLSELVTAFENAEEK